jgi:hypothetical protein
MKIFNLTTLLGFIFLFAGTLSAQQNNNYTISITKNGEKVIDTSFSAENENALSISLFQIGGKYMPEMQKTKKMKWV